MPLSDENSFDEGAEDVSADDDQLYHRLANLTGNIVL